MTESTAVNPDAQDSDAAGNKEYAPRYNIPSRVISAVEIPAIVQNVERGIRAFGRVPSLANAIDSNHTSIPIYLNPESPFCKPLMSHQARTHNIVLKVTVPKRTGRKRKRGSNEPWQDANEGGQSRQSKDEDAPSDEAVHSRSRIDDPKVLRRKLEDNVGKYEIEPVGLVKHTHRFRGAADFYWDHSTSDFSQRYVQQALPGDVQQIKQFKFNPGVDTGPKIDVLPPPIFTHMTLPFNYFYSQNPYVRATDDGGVVNVTAVQHVGYFIAAEDPAPTGPRVQPDMTDPRVVDAIAQLEDAFRDRPVWTRRSLLNHLAGKLKSWNELKKYLNFVAYQFKGGAFRDGVVPYGIDPRSDPKYRKYQTLMFKLSSRARAGNGQSWHTVRKTQQGPLKIYSDATSESHIFDGKTYHTDGKVWQLCDITDPLLQDIIENADIRATCDTSSGWFHGGLWAKIKAIMKTKLVAIQFGRLLSRNDFQATLDADNGTPPPDTRVDRLPLPSLGLTDEELTEMRGYKPSKGGKFTHYARPMGASAQASTTPSIAGEQSAVTAQGEAELDLDDEESDNEDHTSASGSDEDQGEEPTYDEYDGRGSMSPAGPVDETMGFGGDEYE